MKRDHPCLALPCAFILSMGIGVALTIMIMPFSATGSLVGAMISISVTGVWFAILSGAWYGRSKDNLLWAVITIGLSWFLLCAGIIMVSPSAAFPIATLVCILVFFFSFKFIELNQDSSIPIPHLISERKVPDYQQQYPHVVDSGRIKQKSKNSNHASQPRYWDSWKGQVILAIAEARTPLALHEIAARSKLDSDKALTVIRELHDLGVIRYESYHKYSVERQVYHEYRAYIKENQRSIPVYSRPGSKSQRTGGHKHKTNNGEMVRSKSEVIVANTLTRLGLSYEYEKRLENPYDCGDSIKPDFTIYHSGKFFYWEHLGMLQNPSYKKKWEWKQNWYGKCGFDVIISRDGEDGSIDSQTIEAIAKSRILQS